LKILFADKFPEAQMTQLQDQGHDCDLQPDLVGDTLPGAVADTEVLVVRSTKVTAQAIDAAASLRLVVRAGAGANTIDKDAAADRGIPVCNVPGKNAVAVAELVLGLLLAIDRRIPENVIDLRAGRWNKKQYSVAQGLYGRHMGIIGLGAIGLAVAERARAFGIHVYVVDKPDRSAQTRKTLANLGLETVPDLDTLLKSCDIISLHVPSAAETKGMVDAAFLDKLQPGTIVINASRGDVIDEQALLSAMDDKGIRAGLDVYADEPASGEGAFSSALASHPNTCGTHHIGASTDQAQTAVADGVLEVISAFADGTVLHCVNGQG
jgi:D-3-phosphoglycerate dehydrogenase|tara:strand:+ start:607 stop:1575 length:969 start_codon:yes stop_codon:yes gene_type:complete